MFWFLLRVDIAYHAKKEFSPPFISNVKYLYEASNKSHRLQNTECLQNCNVKYTVNRSRHKIKYDTQCDKVASSECQ
jgi:hypothetical protein